MILGKNEISIVEGFIETHTVRGMVSRAEVNSLVESVEGILPDDMTVNHFTSIATSTGMEQLIPHLNECATAGRVAGTITIDMYRRSLHELSDLLELRGFDVIKGGIVADIDLISRVFTTNFIHRFEGECLINPLDLEPIKFITHEEEAIKIITDLKSADLTSAIETVRNRILAILQIKKSNIDISLIRYLMVTDITLSGEFKDAPFEEVSIDKMAKELLFTNKADKTIATLSAEVKAVKAQTFFDVEYDKNVDNTDHEFTYDRSYEHVEIITALFKDKLALNVMLFFKLLFGKQTD